MTCNNGPLQTYDCTANIVTNICGQTSKDQMVVPNETFVQSRTVLRGFRKAGFRVFELKELMHLCGPGSIARRLRQSGKGIVRWLAGRLVLPGDLGNSRQSSVVPSTRNGAGRRRQRDAGLRGGGRAVPQAFIAVITAGLPYEVLRHNPFIDRLIQTPSAHEKSPLRRMHVLRAGRSMERFDCCISDCGNMKTRMALLAIVSKAKWRIGFTTTPELYHLPMLRDSTLSVRDDNLRLTEILGLGRYSWNRGSSFPNAKSTRWPSCWLATGCKTGNRSSDSSRKLAADNQQDGTTTGSPPLPTIRPDMGGNRLCWDSPPIRRH